MLLQKIQMCFNDTDYVTIHSVINIMTANDVKMTQKMQQKYFEDNAIWHLLEKSYYKHTMTNVAVWLTCYVDIFAILSYLATVKQYLKIFFSENYVSLERAPLD